MNERRIPILVVLGLVLAVVVAGGLTVDRRPGIDTTPEVEELDPADLLAVAPGSDSLGSTWYCAAGTADDDGQADHRILVGNPGDQPVTVRITAFPGANRGEAVTAEPASDDYEVEARSLLSVRLEELVSAPFVGAIVEAGPGEVVVEHTVGSSRPDLGAGPCESTSSSTWYLAAGTTTRDASEQLVLFNPFPGDAVVDMTFTTPDGVRSPPEFTGFIVPGRRVTVVDVGAIVSRHPNVSTSVRARTGRLVVERLQRFDGTDGPAGLEVTPAVPAPALVWYLPDGLVREGVTETVTVYNPTDRQAEVDVEVTLDRDPNGVGAGGVEPFALSIGPQAFAQVPIHDDDRVPDGLGHALTVRSQNGVPVVVERWIRSGSPAPRSGFAATPGSPVVATRWLSAVGTTATESGQAEFLVVVNPDPTAIARITVVAPAPSQDLRIAGLEDVEIPAAGRAVIDLGDYVNRGGLVLVITSTLPVVVERGVYPQTGFAQSILVPSVSSAEVADVDIGGGVPPITSPPVETSVTTVPVESTTTSVAPTTTATTVAPPP